MPEPVVSAIGANHDLALGIVNSTDREGGTVFLRGEAHRDCPM
jgi:hypothetical protein